MSQKEPPFYGEVDQCNLWANGWSNTLGGSWQKDNEWQATNDIVKQIAGPGLNNDMQCGIFHELYDDNFGPRGEGWEHPAKGEENDQDKTGHPIKLSADNVKNVQKLSNKMNTFCGPDPNGCCNPDAKWCTGPTEPDLYNKTYKDTIKKLNDIGEGDIMYLKDYSNKKAAERSAALGTFMNCYDKTAKKQKEICKNLGLGGDKGKDAYYKCGYFHNVVGNKTQDISNFINAYNGTDTEAAKAALKKIEPTLLNDSKINSVGVDLCLPTKSLGEKVPENIANRNPDVYGNDARNPNGFVDNVSPWCFHNGTNKELPGKCVPPQGSEEEPEKLAKNGEQDCETGWTYQKGAANCFKYPTKDFSGFYSPGKDTDAVKYQPDWVNKIVGDGSNSIAYKNAYNVAEWANGDADHIGDQLVQNWRTNVANDMGFKPDSDSDSTGNPVYYGKKKGKPATAPPPGKPRPGAMSVS